MNKTILENNLKDLVKILNPGWQKDPDMKETPGRLARLYMHFFRNENPQIHLSKKFPSQNRQLVVIKNLKCYGMCPHHLMPIIYKIHVGYKPNGWVLGLSKFSRIATAVASYPKIQENLTSEIADVIYSGLKPEGVIVVVEGNHGCMNCRGVEQDSVVVTYDVKGKVFTDSLLDKNEFFNMLKVSL